MQWTENEVIGFVDAQLLACFTEVAGLQFVYDSGGPTLQFSIQQLRAPPAPEYRPSPDTIRQPGELRIRVPSESPQFFPGLIGTVVPPITQIFNAGLPGRVQPQQWQILDMLRQCNWSALEDQDAMAAALILGEKVLSENSAERTTPNNNDIEGAGIVL